MHWSDRRVFEKENVVVPQKIRKSGTRLRAAAAALLALTAGIPSGFAQDVPTASTNKAASALPSAPVPTQTEPLTLRQSARDFSKPAGGLLGNPINIYRPTTIATADFNNSVRLQDLLKNGKIYLSLSDAIALALENNYDIAIARYYLDIADTDVLRAKSGASLRGVGAAVLQNTLGGTSQTLSASGAPGTVSGATTGSAGIVLSTDGAGPLPENRDPAVSGALQFDRQKSPATSSFSPRAFTNTNSYNFTYTQGFVTGTALNLTWNNSRTTTTNFFNSYSPQILSNFSGKVTQHLLQGAGIWVNNRFVYEAILDRRITDSTFRQQILATVNQVENIYWVVVSAYEDVQAKQHALDQSTKLDSDTRKQLQIGTMAPLDVVNADSTVATDKQALITSQSNLNYQQLVLKQAIARNLNDARLVAAPIVPTDRVNLDPLPEESQTPDELAQTAFKNRPELEQAVLSIKKDEITLRGARNNLLPTLDVFGYYGAQGIGGDFNPASCQLSIAFGQPCTAFPSTGYSDTLSNLVNSSSPDKGIGFNFQIPIRNRAAQADQARSLIEYRQAEMHLEQLYTQIRMQVSAQQFALANDRAQVQASIAAEDYAHQSLDAEQKKLNLGASTTANVLLQQRNLANAQNTLITARLTYAKDRALLYQVLASTLQHYGINLNDAATGKMTSAPAIPGLQPATNTAVAPTAPPATN
ncbi:MAG TPA: TolC family protein [Terracidiphilus sp.]|jgi:outer membrane protein TolC|nr:TolC family protein [Terracidiphilus sp.]